MRFFSPKFLALLDWFFHKAPYWSIQNYERRVDVAVREAFLKLVEQHHSANVSEFAGMTIHNSTETPYADVGYGLCRALGAPH